MIRVVISALLVAAPAVAQSPGLPVEGEILEGWREADGNHMAGLSLSLAPGWKTYWRSPGEGGIPPRFNWSGSENVGSVQVSYPIPRVMDQNGLQSIGYDSDVVFPLVVTPRDKGAPVRLRAEIDIGVCEEVCIPMRLQLSGVLPSKGQFDRSIGDSLANQPSVAGSFDCEIVPISDGLHLRASAAAPQMVADVAIIEISDPQVWVSPSNMSRDQGDLVAEVEMVAPTAQPFALARSEVRLTVIGDGKAVEFEGCR